MPKLHHHVQRYFCSASWTKCMTVPDFTNWRYTLNNEWHAGICLIQKHILKLKTGGINVIMMIVHQLFLFWFPYIPDYHFLTMTLVAICPDQFWRLQCARTSWVVLPKIQSLRWSAKTKDVSKHYVGNAYVVVSAYIWTYMIYFKKWIIAISISKLSLYISYANKIK